MEYRLLEVGGKIRDEMLGLTSKDIDYTVVITNREDYDNPLTALRDFEKKIRDEGYEVFLVTDEAFTIRAKFPEDHVHSGVADFVLSRKEIGYTPGTRSPIVELGTLEDDLIRRDFTVNAMARVENGDIIDLFNGEEDLRNRILRTPTDAHITFNDDPLRILRALRFAVTKDFNLSDQVVDAIKTYTGDFSVVSTERVQSELNKMFNCSTIRTLLWLNTIKEWNTALFNELFPEGWKLNMTNKT